ncbi:cytidylate kinase [Alkalibacterium putridalgicola]|uniref:Cytidylate kinase n=1 Tax=Alkalibacterium putridalgicola TaxID=426703 RepID=A0A1H7PZH0_9LACT|nr:(d)CMP kinase [Alkalibacterium putridalgicola]GEK88091.1 cytidylate kinase [Alkalibacterium putridalgicola]SEL41230.1 cytidylate kinase [Alkalibacterium putridalgicola]
MDNKSLTIAIDGPASSGKSTVAKRIAADLGLIYVDTGAMYRTLTFEALKNNVNIKDQKALVDLLEKTEITFEPDEKGQSVFSNGVDVTYGIRDNNVTNTVSVVAAHPKVRQLMVKRQQDMAQDNGVVMDGRDIGTVVLPDADLKIFLVASVKERAERRHKENKEKGIFSDLDQLKKDIAERDYKDSTRDSSPLKQAEDAVRIDTTKMTIDEVVDTIKNLIKKA